MTAINILHANNYVACIACERRETHSHAITLGTLVASKRNGKVYGKVIHIYNGDNWYSPKRCYVKNALGERSNYNVDDLMSVRA